MFIFDLKDLHEDISLFVDMITGYLNAANGGNFVQHTTEICRSEDKNTITAVVELLSKIDDIRILSIMEDLIDTATENNETLVATTSSNGNNNYLQTVVSSTVTYIENYLKSNKCNDFRKSRCKQTLQKVSSICTHVEIFRKINTISLDTSIQLSSCWNFTDLSINDLNWEIVGQLTSPTTPYEAIKCFAEQTAAEIHPCVVVEIVLKWWSVRTDREHVNMSFTTPLIKTIQNVGIGWYNSVYRDERYKGLMETLDIPVATTARYMVYRGNNNNIRILKDCISKGDGTPVQLEDLRCSVNMERYRQSVPAFRYNAAEFPPYGDTKHHWYINTLNNHVSLITDSKEEMLHYINDAWVFELNFVPLPDTLQ